MQSIAIIVSVLAAIGALACWVYGARAYLQTLRTVAAGQSRLNWILAANWLFTRKRLEGAAAEQIARVNKALVSFITCVMVGLSAAALASNLSRFSR